MSQTMKVTRTRVTRRRKRLRDVFEPKEERTETPASPRRTLQPKNQNSYRSQVEHQKTCPTCHGAGVVRAEKR